MLGEQDHGDAPAFLAKTRLIKYLHEEKGFNVLGFESDFFGMNEGWSALEKKSDLMQGFLRKNISPIWSECDAMQHLLYSYIPATYAANNPLILTGFDSEIFFSWSSKYLYDKLDSVLKAVAAPITRSAGYETEIFPAIRNWFHDSVDTTTFKKIDTNLKQIRTELSIIVGSDNFWVKLAGNLITNHVKLKAGLSLAQAARLRDSLMAENLAWITDVKFRAQKVIVWGANNHVQKYSGHFYLKFLNEVTSMGSFFTADSITNRKVYILGFTSLRGSAGRLYTKSYALHKPKKNSFENWISKSSNYAFVNFQEYTNPNDELFYMSGMGHNNYLAPWHKVYDGVFFIRTMYPCNVEP